MLDINVQKNSDPKILNEKVDLYRLDASRRLHPASKARLGQYLTPAPVATFMASLFTNIKKETIKLLDAGAGIGSLSAAFVTEFCKGRNKPQKIEISAYEIDPFLFDYLDDTLSYCGKICKEQNVALSTDIIKSDFIGSVLPDISEKLFNPQSGGRFTHAILNPPYKKIKTDSSYRALLNTAGIEVNNLYSAFVTLAIRLLEPKGELVAITPRSFCNGPYFKYFRQQLLKETTLKHIHIFESRTATFNQDNVLQENIIFHCIKGKPKGTVTISSSFDSSFCDLTSRKVKQQEITDPKDSNLFIYIPTNDLDQKVFEQIKSFNSSLYEMNIEVSTGPVVDFRSKELLRDKPEKNTVPLIYPCHFHEGFIQWPAKKTRKANAIIRTMQTEKYFFPNGFYVVVNRFSPKEGKKRINAALYSKETTSSPSVAFENHLNVFHFKNKGISENVAKGLLVYLNSSLVDIFFRQFNGHTQVNATDLRYLPYPNIEQLLKFADIVTDTLPSQDKIDAIIEKEVNPMSKSKSINPVKAKKKILQALDILKTLDFPREQQNDRSALTLLALLNMKPNKKWTDAENVLIGITPIMDFCKQFYGRQYAPNTRETFRRQTMHQFVQAGLVIENPDEPNRPTNSPKWCYQLEESALKLIQKYGTKEWKISVKEYLSNIISLRQKYANHREMLMIPVKISKNQKIKLSPGKHNLLTKAILEDFAPRFIPGAKVIYVGDTADKWGYFEKDLLDKIGIKSKNRGKMPDVVLYYPSKDWYVLVEAVTSHGPVDGKRQEELKKLFSQVEDKLVFVTAFPSRALMTSYLGVISWETEVWVADAPTHLIHFNGIRFLGPYKKNNV